MDIRKGKESDLAALVQFNQALAFETEGLMLADYPLTRGVSRLLTSQDKGFYLVAEINDHIVGSLMVTFEWSDWRANNYYWIQSVYIRPEFRRQGVYAKLYQAVKEMANAEGGAASFRLYVEKENTNAQATYQKLGMRESHYLMYEE